MSKLSPKVKALILGGASLITLSMAFLGEVEGTKLEAYQDGAEIWTICMGHTKGVKKGDIKTQKECDSFFKEDISNSFKDVDRLVKVPLSTPALAAIVSFCSYNIGATKCAKSTFLKKLNSGDRLGACNELTKWVFVGGKDCRLKSSNCAGIVKRREMERELCLM